MSTKIRNKIGGERWVRAFVLLVGVLLTVGAGWLGLYRLGDSLRLLSYDFPFLFHRAGGTEEICMVYIDKMEAGAVSRKDQAALLDQLNKAGARAVIYDLFFDKKSDDPEIDKDFAESILRFRGVDSNDQPVPGARQRDVFLAAGRSFTEQEGVKRETLDPPIEALELASTDMGPTAMKADSFYFIRQLTAGTEECPSMAWRAAQSLGYRKLSEESRSDERYINYASMPALGGAGQSSSGFLVRLASDVLTETEPDRLFKDKIVLVGGKPGIGGEALGQDLFNSPLHRFDMNGTLTRVSGVEIQGNVLANLLNGNWLVRSTALFDSWFILLVGLVAGGGFTLLRPAVSLWIGLLGAVVLAALGILSVRIFNTWFPWSVAACLQLPFAFFWAWAARFYVERFLREKLVGEHRGLQDAFAKYLSPQMLERLATENYEVRTGGESVEVAIMFTDIESFTDMCERVQDPEIILQTLNDYFQRTTSHVFEYDGVVVQFIGDAILAAWGAPIRDPDAATKAAHAAWMVSQNDKISVEGLNLRTRIGLHFGPVVAGNVGSDRHLDYALVGDAVNLASRLEALNSKLGTHLLLSDALHDRLQPGFRTRRIGRFRFKGRKEATTVYELLGPALQATEPPWIAAYHQALCSFEAGHTDESRAFFLIADRDRPHGDGPSRFFMELLDSPNLMADGIVVLGEK
jgi:class 3 adenylate cyclase/CHASE2 domain-containing sensor protein